MRESATVGAAAQYGVSSRETSRAILLCAEANRNTVVAERVDGAKQTVGKWR